MSAKGAKLARAIVWRSGEFAKANLEAKQRTMHARIIQEADFGKVNAEGVKLARATARKVNLL